MNNTRILEQTKRFVLALTNAYRALQMYPAYNPIPSSATQQAFEILSEIVKNRGSIYLRFSKNQIYEGNEPLIGSENEYERMSILSQALIERGISSFLIFEGVTKNEVISFLNILLTDPEEIHSSGGVGSIASNGELTHIKINEIPKEVNFKDSETEATIEAAVRTKEHYLLEILSSMLLKDNLTENDLKLIEHLLSKPKDLRSVLSYIAGNKADGTGNINLLETVVKRLFHLADEKFASAYAKETLINAVISLPQNIAYRLVISMLFSAVRNELAKDFIESISPEKLSKLIISAHDSETTRIEKVGSVLNNINFAETYKNALVDNLTQELIKRGYSTEEAAVILGKAEEIHSNAEAQIEKVDDFEAAYTSYTGAEESSETIRIEEVEETPQDLKLLSFLKMEAQKFRAEDHIARSLLSMLLYIDNENSVEEVKKVFDLIMPSLTAEGNFAVLTEAIPLLEKIKSDEQNSEYLRSFAKELLNELSLKKYIYQAFEVMANSSEGTSSYKSAFQFLLQLPRENVLQGLIEILSTEEMLSRRKLLIKILSTLGKDSVELLGERISAENEKWYLIRNLVIVLGNIATEECVDYISNALKHPDFRVKKEAVKALCSIGGDKACEAILEGYEEENAEFKMFILKNIGATQSKKALEIILPIVEKKDFFLSDLEWKLAAIESLAKIPFAEARVLLENLAQTRSFLFRRKAKKISSAARNALSVQASRNKGMVIENERSQD